MTDVIVTFSGKAGKQHELIDFGQYYVLRIRDSVYGIVLPKSMLKAETEVLKNLDRLDKMEATQ